eukprot:GGOE01053618.1.p1 GENE.GGOE01053618.1~~GGOE01053618.1.p1  ORF type:complete len:455 (+),score=79.26 GGOE01053618.1:27-1367(+)
MKRFIDKIESKIGVDIDGDGLIGGKFPVQNQQASYPGRHQQPPPHHHHAPPAPHHHGPPAGKPGGYSGQQMVSQWSCPACTFSNPGSRNSCEMCSTPKPVTGVPLKPQPSSSGGWTPTGSGPVAYDAFHGNPYSPAPIGVTPVAVGQVYIPQSGRKKALLIGINYFGTRAQLRGCINDVKNMRDLLASYGFPCDGQSMVVLTDDARDHRFMPTRRNMENAMQWLVSGAQPGDILFFHYSGHGAQQRDTHGDEADGYDETILPVDFKSAGQIVDDEIFDLLVRPLPSGVRMTAVMDCCHSGTGMDLPFTWTGRGWTMEPSPCHSQGDVQLFSGCADSQTSADVQGWGGAGGAMTTAFVEALQSNPHHTYPSLMKALHRHMNQKGHRQQPQLSSSQQFDLSKPFSLSDIVPNMNPQIGRLQRKRKKRKTLLIAGAALAGGLLLGDLLF